MSNSVFLFESWPEAKRKGKYDDLNSRFEIPGKLVLIPNSKWCKINGQFVRMQDKAYFTGQDWLLPKSVIDSFVIRPQIKTEVVDSGKIWKTQPIVTLDAGHGGKDPGAVGIAGTREKDVALDIVLRMKQILNAKKVHVKMIREDDVFVGLHERCEISNQNRSTLFVSVHCNAISKRHIKGFQIFTQSDKVSVASRARFCETRFPLPEYSPVQLEHKKKSLTSHYQLFQWKDLESDILSQNIYDQLSYRNSKVRTQPQSNFCVLRETMAPSVLVEVDFISNPEVEVNMSYSEWRQKMAEDICKGILTYVGLGPNS